MDAFSLMPRLLSAGKEESGYKARCTVVLNIPLCNSILGMSTSGGDLQLERSFQPVRASR